MRLTLIYIIILLMTTISLPAQIIKTVVGTTCGYSGDGGLATNAKMSVDYYCYPAFDNAGNMYFAESGLNIIRRVDGVTGKITTIAGTFNSSGNSGDGGLATNALLNRPAAIAVDDAGNIYFADQVSSVIRMINPAGIISTVSGGYGTTCGLGDGGPLIGAQFDAISGLTTDHNGNLYVSDYGCDMIRKVNSAGIVTIVAGNGHYGFLGDGGPATSAQLAYPCKVAVDNNGNIYIPDTQNNRVRRVDAVTGIITTVAGTGLAGYTGDGGPATAAEIYFPGSVVLDNAGNFYFGDDNMVIRKVDPAGTITTFAGNGTRGYTGDGGLASAAGIYLTNGFISTDNNGNIYFNNYNSCVIREVETCSSPLSINHTPIHTQICNVGTAVFSITAGNAAGYGWQVNDGTGWKPLADDAVYAGSNTNQLTITSSNVSVNGWLFRCNVTNSCTAMNSVPDTLDISTLTAPSLSITADANPVCAGTTATFTAIPFRGGSAPQYQWIKNGVNVGTNAALYSDNALTNNDKISCTLTSSDNCVTTQQAVSNNIKMTIGPALLGVLSLDKNPLLCANSNRTLDAGNFAAYLWNDGSNSETLLVTDTGQYRVKVTDKNGCTASDSVHINVFAPVPADFLPVDTSICSNESLTIHAKSGFVNYSWSDHTSGPTIIIKQPGLYNLEVTDQNNCVGKETMQVVSLKCAPGFHIPSAFTPNTDGRNDLFRPLLYGNMLKYKFSIYNRLGQLVFESSDPKKGWDGTMNGVRQDANTFVWFCDYQLSGDSPKSEKGTVVLIR